MSQFRDAYGEFRRAGAEVAAVSVDSPYCHRAWARDLRIPYPLISDFNRDLLRAYDALAPGSTHLPNVAKRAAFVIEPDLVLRYVWYRPESGGLPPVEEVLEAVRALTST